MAQANARSSSSRSSSKSSSGSKSRNGSSRSRNGSSRASSARPKASARSRNGSSPAQQQQPQNGAAKTLIAAGGTVAGLVGGVVLGSRFARKPKRVLGVKVPGTGGGLDGFAKQLKRASKQLGELTDEVRTAREKAEQVGKVIS